VQLGFLIDRPQNSNLRTLITWFVASKSKVEIRKNIRLTGLNKKDQLYGSGLGLEGPTAGYLTRQRGRKAVRAFSRRVTRRHRK